MPTAQSTPSPESQARSRVAPQSPSASTNVTSNSSVKSLADRVIAASKKSDNVKDGILMADGTLRTKDHVIIKKAGWQTPKSPLGKAWLAVRRQYLRVTLRWPRWARRTALVAIIALLLANAAFLTYVARNSRIFNANGNPLPKLAWLMLMVPNITSKRLSGNMQES